MEQSWLAAHSPGILFGGDYNPEQWMPAMGYDGESVWIDDLHLICQVETTGQITDPLAGRIPAMATAGSGRGLLLINQLCDLVRMHSGPSGTTTRVYIRRP